jgi:hypothetical protein
MVAQLQFCRSITPTYCPRFVSWPRHLFLGTTEPAERLNERTWIAIRQCDWRRLRMLGI